MRICVVTLAHLSTSPRMLKAADALAEAGHDVRLVSIRHMPWATATDADVRTRHRRWTWTEIRYDSALPYQRSRLVHHAARRACALIGPSRAPRFLRARALARFYDEVLSGALAAPVDLFYGGTRGGVALVAHAAELAGVPFGVDLEDLHHHEDRDPLNNALAERILRDVLPRARFVTTASSAMADAYATDFGLRPTAVHNTFPLTVGADQPPPSPGLRLYWFSQTIGTPRGLEQAVEAMAELPGELHLRGREVPGYVATLRRLAARVAPRLTIHAHAPAPPDSMVDLCRGYDVGLSLEQPDVQNHTVCLGNKALTYPLVGLPVALSDTPGHRELARDLGEGALVVPAGDVAALAAGLRRWATDPALLARARMAARDAACRRWHWEHPLERGALVEAVQRALA